MALIRSASMGIPCAAPVELQLGCLFEPAQLFRRGASGKIEIIQW